MHLFRDVPPVSTGVDGLLDGGHLWLQELLVGAPFRFQLRSSGRLRVGDGETEYDPEDVPPQYRHAVRHVRESCDWSALRAALDDVESVVFFGRAMHQCGLDYDWERTPSFLGTDVWVGERAAFLGVDRVEHIFERLGLDPVNTFAKEVRAVDFDPSSYEFPQSAWYDGPAAGVVIRNKRGACGTLDNPAVDVADDPSFDPTTAEELAAAVATPARVQRAVTALERQGRPATFDAVYERVLETVYRELHPSRFAADLDLRAFRSTVAELTRERL